MKKHTGIWRESITKQEKQKSKNIIGNIMTNSMTQEEFRTISDALKNLERHIREKFDEIEQNFTNNLKKYDISLDRGTEKDKTE